jgi:hypothetical protein
MQFIDVGQKGLVAAIQLIFVPRFAFAAFLVILLAALWLGWRQWRRTLVRTQALQSIVKALNPVRDAADEIAAHQALKENYQTVRRAVNECGDTDVQNSWIELEESIVDPQADILRNTVRPDEFFHHLAEPSRGLLLWANIAVAAGLVITFLGIIAALANTSIALNGKDAANALPKLLDVTSAKFLSSVAGVLASIGLRLWDRRLQDFMRDTLNELTSTLERGLLYLPPQRLAAAQLASLEQIATAQTTLANSLAVAISEKLNEQFSPMITVLGNIDKSIGQLSRDLTDGVTKGVADAVSDVSGREMQALAAALATMTDRLGNVPDMLGKSAEDANLRIQEAAQLFRSTADQMEISFLSLGEKIAAMGSAAAEQQEEAGKQFVVGFRDAAVGFEGAGTRSAQAVDAASDRMAALLRDVAGTLTAINAQSAADAAAASEAVRVSSDATRRDLEQASKAAAATLVGAANEGAKAAAATAAESLEAAFADFVARFEAAGGQFTDRLDGSSNKVLAFGGHIERASENARRQSDALAAAAAGIESLNTELASATRAAAEQLAKASATLNTALAPVEDAVGAIADASEEIAAALAQQLQNSGAQTVEWQRIAKQFEATATAARQAWAQYQERFEGVDEALSGAITQIISAASSNAERINAFASEVDENLGRAVLGLKGAVDQLDELPDAIREAAAELKAR